MGHSCAVLDLGHPKLHPQIDRNEKDGRVEAGGAYVGVTMGLGAGTQAAPAIIADAAASAADQKAVAQA